MIFGNSVERLKKKAEKAKQTADLEKKALTYKLQSFFSREQVVTTEEEVRREGQFHYDRDTKYEKTGSFLLPAFSTEESKQKAEDFVKFYENKLKQIDKTHICTIKPDQNNVNQIVLQNEAKMKLSPPGGAKSEPFIVDAIHSLRIKELDKMARSYGKALTKHWDLQKSLGNATKPMPIKNQGR